MIENLPWFHQITIYWTQQEIEHTKYWLITLPLTGDNSIDRLIIQDCIDKHNLKASILYEWSKIFSYRKVIEQYKKILKYWVKSISDYLYKFFSLNRTMSYHGREDWISYYPNISDIENILLNAKVAVWETDNKRILDWLLSISNLIPWKNKTK